MKIIMKGRLNEAQIELVALFSSPLSDERFAKLKRMLLDFRAEELTNMVNEKFDDLGIHPDDLITEHMRTPYSTKN